MDPGTLAAAEAKARTLLRSSSPPPPPPSNLLPRPGNGYEPAAGGAWPAMPNAHMGGGAAGPWAEPGGLGMGMGGHGLAGHQNGMAGGHPASGTPTKPAAFPWLGGGGSDNGTWQPHTSGALPGMLPGMLPTASAAETADWGATSSGLPLDNIGHLMSMMHLQQQGGNAAPGQASSQAPPSTNGASNAPGSVESNTTSGAAKEEGAGGDLDWDHAELQQLVQQATAQ